MLRPTWLALRRADGRQPKRSRGHRAFPPRSAAYPLQINVGGDDRR
jgi:hypothetical protein